MASEPNQWPSIGKQGSPGSIVGGDMSKPGNTQTSRIRSQGLFPCEAEIARRLSQTPEEWAAKAKMLERNGLPRIDPVMGGRYWPAVRAVFDRLYGLHTVEVSQPDGQENLDAL